MFTFGSDTVVVRVRAGAATAAFGLRWLCPPVRWAAGVWCRCLGVVGGATAELVAGQFGCLVVVDGGLLAAGAGWPRAGLQQRFWRGGAVEVAVADDRSLVGAAGSAVVRVQVLDQARAGPGAAGWPSRRGRGGSSRSRR